MVSSFYKDNKGRETRQTPTHFVASFGDIDVARNFFKNDFESTGNKTIDEVSRSLIKNQGHTY